MPRGCHSFLRSNYLPLRGSGIASAILHIELYTPVVLNRLFPT